jgi:hypothetical protein
LQADFEGILKFFRVNLPRKYRTEANAKELIHAAVKLKVNKFELDKSKQHRPYQISHKRLAKYENEWHELKKREIEYDASHWNLNRITLEIHCLKIARSIGAFGTRK